MYRLIACDLDETLLNDQHQICQANIDAIKKASAMGVKFIPATGRSFRSIDGILKTLDLFEKENEYVLSFNGCAITENKENQLLIFDGLDFDTAKQLFTFGLTKNVCIQIYTTQTIYVYNFNDDERQRFNNMGIDYVELFETDIDFLKDAAIAKVIYQNTDVPYMMSFEEEMKPITAGKVAYTYSSNRYTEFNRLGVNKGDALLKLAELLNVPNEETVAVGDNYNDIPMLEKAGFSVAAGNSVKAVKEMCDYVCVNDHNQGVLAEFLEKFVFK